MNTKMSMWLNLNGYAFKESMFCKPWVYIVIESQLIKCLICFVFMSHRNLKFGSSGHVTVVVSFLSFCRTLVPGRVCNGSN